MLRKIYLSHAYRILFALLLPPFLFSGCEYRKFEFVTDYNRQVAYAIDATGPFSASGVITEQDVLNELDIPEDGTITKVDIKALNVIIETLDEEGNEATSIFLSGRIRDTNSGGEPLFEGANYPVPLKEVNIPFVGKVSAQRLVDKGVSKLKNKIGGFVMHLDNGSFAIEIEGDPGEDTRVVLGIYIEIVSTITYTSCVEVLSPLDAGDECDS